MARLSNPEEKKTDKVKLANTHNCHVCGIEVPKSQLICPTDGIRIIDLPGSDAIAGNRYEFISVVAAGGNGVIYKGRQVLLDKPVAIKMVQGHLLTDLSGKRFHQEAKAASSLNHPNVISVHDFGLTTKGDPYLVMDWVEGHSFSSEIKKRGMIPWKEAMDTFLQVCDGLAHAHTTGVLHRDLKPSNLMVTKDQTGNRVVKIVDFGIAKLLNPDEDTPQLTRTGEVMGSPLYMSPEQGVGKRVDIRSDLYSFGCVMFETLTGDPPHVGDSTVAVLLKHQNEAPPTLKEAALGTEYPDGLEKVIAKLLAKDPADRYQTAAELKEDLLKVKAGQSIGGTTKQSSRPSSKAEDTKSKSGGASPVAIGASIAIIALLAVGGWWMFLTDHGGNKPSQPDAEHAFASDLQKVKIDFDTGPNRKEGHYVGFKLNDEAVDLIRQMKSQTSLDLEQSSITDDQLAILEPLKSVRQLNLTGTSITDDGLDSVASFPKLTNLSLAKTKITDGGLGELESLPLESLHLDNTPITDLGLQTIGRINTLKELYIPGTNITGLGLTYLKNLPALCLLSVADVQLTGSSLEPLRTLNQLGSLDLSGTRLTDRDMESVSRITSIVNLKLNRTSVSKVGLKQLAGLKQLKTLAVVDCPEIHANDVAEFHKLLPSCVVVTQDDGKKTETKRD